MLFGVSVIYFDKKDKHRPFVTGSAILEHSRLGSDFFFNLFLPSEHFIIGNEDSEMIYIRYMAAFRP